MNLLQLLIAFSAGILLGVFFFGGLWITVHRLPKTVLQGLWILGSFAFRTAVVLIGFYVFTNGRWENTLACMVGFLVARTMVLRYASGTDESDHSNIRLLQKNARWRRKTNGNQ